MNEEGFVIAGTSAGAMAMSNTMIYQGKSELAHLKGEVKITTGLAFAFCLGFCLANSLTSNSLTLLMVSVSESILFNYIIILYILFLKMDLN